MFDIMVSFILSKQLVIDGAINVFHTNSESNDNLLLIGGENAAGKSLVFRMIKSFTQKNDLFYAEISMADRNKKGYMTSVYTYGRYGDEDAESTGYLTIFRIKSDIEKVIKIGKNFVIGIDEPELGLGEDLQFALGQYLWQSYCRCKETGFCSGFVISSHSRKVFEGFLQESNVIPQSMYLTHKKSTIDLYHWIKNPINKTVDDLISIMAQTENTNNKLRAYIKAK